MKATWEAQHFYKLIEAIEGKVARLEEKKSKAGAELDEQIAEWEAQGRLKRWLTNKPSVSGNFLDTTDVGRTVFWTGVNIEEAERLLAKIHKAKASFADSVTLSDDELFFINGTGGLK